MYKIYLDNKELWTPSSNDKRLTNPTLNLGVNKVGSFSCKILPGHAYYDSFVKLKSIITVVQDDTRVIFRGRVFSVDTDFRKIKTIQAEGLLGYLNDSIVRTYNFTGSPLEFFTFLINQHNNQVIDNQKFKIGRCTVVDNNDYIVRGSNEHQTTWGEINSKLIDLLGGYISIRYENDGNYIDYLADYTDTSTQEIAFSINLLDITLESKGDEIKTCIIPYGATPEDSDLPIDITSVNNGKDYIEDPEAVALYGRITEVVTWDDVTLPENLLKKAKLYLAEKVKLSSKLTVKAIDLHLADKNVESFKLGDYVRVYSEPHGINEVVLLTAYSMDLSAPANCTITLGVEKKSYLTDVSKDNTNRVDIIKKEIGNSVSYDVNVVLGQYQQYVNNQLETSQESTKELLTEYVTKTAFGDYKQSTSTQFKQTSDEFNFQFNKVNERITSDKGEILDQLAILKKYVRIVDGNIILGEVGNPLTTKIANGRISFLYNDIVEVAYITDNKLYITEAEILDKIIIGKFAFLPRSNGNLSFKKIS